MGSMWPGARRHALGKRGGDSCYFRPRVEPLESRAMLAVLGLDFQLLMDDGSGNVLLDNDGDPVTLSKLSDTTHGSSKPLEKDDFFWVQIMAWDERGANANDPAPGVISLPLNVAWDPNVIDYVGENPDNDPGPNPDRVPGLPLDDGLGNPIFENLLTENFAVQRFLTDYDETADNATDLDGFRDPADGPTNANLLGLRGTALPDAGLGAPIGTFRPDDMASPPTWFSRLRFQAIDTADQMPFVMQLAGSMSFRDAAALDGIVHIVGGGTPASADANNRVTEFIQITPPEIELASLSGFVYVDTNPTDGELNRDNVGVAVEFGIPNVALSLFRDNEFVAATTSGADGAYLFNGLDDGVYRIVESHPPLFISSASSVGVVLPSDEARGVAASADEISEIRLAAGDHGIDYNFGEIPVPDKRMFLATTDMREILAGQRGVAARTIEGTAGNDTIVVEPLGDALRVTVNNQPLPRIPLASARILYLDADGGQDTVEFRGGAGNEVANLSPGTGAIRRGANYQDSNYAVMAVAAERVLAEGGSGDDLAIMHDSPSNDELVAAGDAATLTSPNNRLAQALAFERVRALSAARPGGTDQDTADVDATDFVLEIVGKWQRI